MLKHFLTALASCLVVLTGFGAGVAAISATAAAASPTEAFASFRAGSESSVDHSAWDRLIKAYVVVGDDGVARVDYARFKAEDHAAVKRYVRDLEAVDVAALDRPEQFAFWVNLYNVKTIDIVLDAYPVRSIKDIRLGGGLVATFTGGPWKAKVTKIAGMELSLDDIEHAILRPIFKDARVHYAVNCASIGCPNLGPEAFTGTDLERQLDAAARAYVNHPRGATVSKNGLVVSSIYTWFRTDFGGDDQGVIAHLKAYGDDRLRSRLRGVTRISDHAYDWGLNDTRPAR